MNPFQSSSSTRNHYMTACPRVCIIVGMPNENDIIDVEVVSESTSETPDKPVKAKKVATSDHSKAIAFYSTLSRILLRFGSGTFFLFAILGLTFSILYSQSNSTVYLVTLCIFWGLAVAAAASLVLGVIFSRRMIYHMKRDPNYERMIR